MGSVTIKQSNYSTSIVLKNNVKLSGMQINNDSERMT